MKKIFIILFTLFAFNVFAFDVERVKKISCDKPIKTNESSNEVITWNCIFAKETTLEYAYKEILNDIVNEINTTRKILLSKSRIQFKQNVDKAINQKNSKHQITQIGIEGMVYLEPTYKDDKNAEISTNLGIEDENHTFILLQDDTLKLKYVFTKGESLIEKTQSYED